MSGALPEQEPSIEEILASIRQIISDDDDHPPAATAEPDPIPEPEPEPEPAPIAPSPPKEDILELKDPLPPPEMPVIDMEDAVEEDEPMTKEEILPPPLPPEPAPEPEPVMASTVADSILTDGAKLAALSGFSKLSSNMSMDRGTTPPSSSGGSTLEDIVRDMLNPMLRVWLDENLPDIIERLVQKELDKLARKAMDD